jgi:hypothetical protein
MLHNDLTKEVIMLRATMADMRKSVDFFQTDEVINIKSLCNIITQY